MNPWSTFRRGLYGPATVDNTVPPADVVPPGHVVVGTPELDHLERDARIKAAARLVHRTLLDQSLKAEGRRNQELYDVLLELRSILQPSPPAPEVLREADPPLRAMAPRFGSFKGYAS